VGMANMSNEDMTLLGKFATVPMVTKLYFHFCDDTDLVTNVTGRMRLNIREVGGCDGPLWDGANEIKGLRGKSGLWGVFRHRGTGRMGGGLIGAPGPF
jgi:hypothetical protein